LLPPDVIFWG